MRAIHAALISVGLAFATPAANAQSADPLAPAREGAIECIGPNLAARTCSVMSTYRFDADGEIANDYMMHLQNNPEILAYGTNNISVRDGMVCSVVDPAEIEATRFTIDRQQAPPAVSVQLQRAFAEALSGMREICSRGSTEGEVIRLTVFVDGVERADLTDVMIWVRREDGYAVGAEDGSPT